MKLNERLKELRQEKKYSQAYVAEKLNISRQSISKWENGWSCPDVDNLILLSDLYGVQLDELTQFYSETEHPESGDVAVSTNENRETLGFESFALVVVVMLSVVIPIWGVLFYSWIFYMVLKKKMNIPKICIICIVICFLINLNNSIIALNNLFFHVVKVTVK